MRTRATLLILLWAMLLAPGRLAGGQAAADPRGPHVRIETALSRTAAWIGEPVVYTVELRCAPTYDVLLDDLSAERFRVDGGELVRADTEERRTSDGIVRRIRYTFTTYRVDATELRVAPMPVRYYVRRGDTVVEGTPAGEVTVPPAVVAIRSALPDTGGVPVPRESSIRTAPRLIEYLEPVGLALIAIAVVPMLIIALNVGGGIRRAWAARAARGARRRQRISLDQLKETTPDSDSARVAAFTELDVLVRDRLAASVGADVRALTPAEVRRLVAERSPSLPESDIEALLIACESARYSPTAPAATDWERALREAEQVLTATR
jgi:hypothetical protein